MCQAVSLLNADSLSSFAALLASRPDAGLHVRHLWIAPSDTNAKDFFGYNFATDLTYLDVAKACSTTIVRTCSRLMSFAIMESIFPDPKDIASTTIVDFYCMNPRYIMFTAPLNTSVRRAHIYYQYGGIRDSVAVILSKMPSLETVEVYSINQEIDHHTNVLLTSSSLQKITISGIVSRERLPGRVQDDRVHFRSLGGDREVAERTAYSDWHTRTRDAALWVQN